MDQFKWVLVPIDPELPDSLWVGIRYLGVARLKGLPPQELAEAVVWKTLPPDAERVPVERPFIGLLRRLNQEHSPVRTGGAPPPKDGAIPENLLAITYLLEDGTRKWIFGEYRDTDDVILHAIQTPIQTPELKQGEPMEMWLFRNRFELARVYDGLRRETPGISTPLSILRTRPGYLACFLVAPHRALG